MNFFEFYLKLDPLTKIIIPIFIVFVLIIGMVVFTGLVSPDCPPVGG